MSIATACLCFLLTLCTALGLPLTSLAAGFAGALALAVAQRSIVLAAAAMLAGLLGEMLASRGQGGDAGMAEALSLVVFGRALGPWLGVGAWLFAVSPGGLVGALRTAGLQRAWRLLGVLAVLALLAFGLRG